MHTLSKSLVRIRDFVHEHDDIPAFHAAYLVGAFLAAALLNLGFFGVLIVVHMSLDYIKYRDIHHFSRRLTIKAMLRESMIDIALLLLALVFVVYLNHSFALAAISGMARAELTIVRALGTLIPKIEIFENIFTVLLNVERYLHGTAPDPNRALRGGEKWALFIIGVAIFMLGLAFALYHGNEAQLLHVLAKELTPAL